jgi:UDP-N-acetylglucosamine/UDP-N-acetylgalactosamine diphosphorylase
MDEGHNIKKDLLALLKPWRQQHLLDFWDELTADQQAGLAREIEAVDFPLVDRLFRGGQNSDDAAALVARAAPPPAFRLDAAKNEFTPAAARTAGEHALRAGKVAALLVAGGQGTRLGFDHPKGMYAIGPVSGASLFQILFEHVVAVGRHNGVRIPLFLMTSSATHAETVAYLDHTERFGLPAEDLFVFSQGSMPAVDARSGQLLLAEKDQLALGPDGHGGMLAALAATGGMADLNGRGIEQLFYMQIDNPLVRVCDPQLLGYHLLSRSEVTTLAVTKREPTDKVGNLVVVDGKLQIIEYSEFNQLDPALIGPRDPRGGLLFWAGNTAVHVFDVRFLQRVSADADQMPFHVAHKKVPFVDAQGKHIDPDDNNALKFERFIFDLLPAAERAVVVECDEAAEFAPVKNAPGSGRDAPETVQTQMVALHTAWLRAAGGEVAEGVPVEVSPLFALDEAQLREKLPGGKRFDEPTYLR